MLSLIVGLLAEQERRAAGRCQATVTGGGVEMQFFISCWKSIQALVIEKEPAWLAQDRNRFL